MDIPDYKPSILLRNGHSNTIFSALKRQGRELPYKRQRIQTPDDDFVDLDWLAGGNRRVVVILHGLESSSQGTYVIGMAKLLHQHGWDIAAMNYRSCSGEINRQVRVYHAGATDDVELVMDHVLPRYQEVAIVGFSLGANLGLKYAGEQGAKMPPNVKALAAVSAPLDLLGCSQEISYRRSNWLYQQIFLRSLREKVRLKSPQYPDIYNKESLRKIKKLIDFDDVYTGPVNGFKDGTDYYTQSTAMHVIDQIAIPALLINALDDPFLRHFDLPASMINHPYLKVHLSSYGGHVGFSYLTKRENWMEQQVLRFLQSHVTETPTHPS